MKDNLLLSQFTGVVRCQIARASHESIATTKIASTIAKPSEMLNGSCSPS